MVSEAATDVVTAEETAPPDMVTEALTHQEDGAVAATATLVTATREEDMVEEVMEAHTLPGPEESHTTVATAVHTAENHTVTVVTTIIEVDPMAETLVMITETGTMAIAEEMEVIATTITEAGPGVLTDTLAERKGLSLGKTGLALTAMPEDGFRGPPLPRERDRDLGRPAVKNGPIL